MRLAKTSIPSPARAVARQRLFDRLDTSSSGRSVWVSGPPGAGKTTLVATWVAARRLECLWYRVDASDADLGSFFFHLARAEERRSHRARTTRLPHFTPEYLGAEAAFARRFFRELAARRRRRLVVVFDDLAALRPDAPLFLALREGLEELAGAASAVLISREIPPPSFARLVANGALESVDGEELLLSRAEALAVGRVHARRGTPRHELARVCERAAGWTAGIVLLLRGAGEGSAAATTPALFDYLAGEIFDREDPEVRRVLECAALLPAVPAALADRVCGSERAGAILGDLARRAYFTLRGGSPDSTFELHPLFREFLLARLGAERAPDDVCALRLRAARALENADRLDQAAELFVEARAWDEVVRIGLAIAPTFLATGRAQTLEPWLRAIPVDLRAERPWVSYWLGECRLPFDFAEARRHLRHAYAGFERTADVQGQYAASAAMIDTILIEWSDFTGIEEWLVRLEALRKRGLVASPRELDLRVTTSTFGAMTFHRNDDPALVEWEYRVLEIIRDASVPLRLRAMLGAWFLVESAMRGENTRGGAVVDSLAPLARAPGVDPPTTLAWLAGESVYHWHTGSPAEALVAVSKALDLARDSGVHLWDFILHLQGVNAALAEEDLVKARAFLAAAQGALRPGQPLNAAVLAHEEGLVALRAGDLARAAACGRAAVAAGELGAMPFFRCLGELMVALAATAQGDVTTARASIASARRLGAMIQSHLPEVLGDMCDADLALRAGDRTAAREHLARALALSREKRVAPDVWFSRAQLAELSALALDADIELDHVRALVRRLRLEPPETARVLEGWPWRVRIRVLGPLEATLGDDATPLGGKAHRRPLEILAVLAALGHADVADDVVANVLWPDSEGDLAHHALETALYRLRHLLGEGVILHRERLLGIDHRTCWVDAVAVDALLARASASVERHAVTEALECARRAVDAYRGPFLAQRDEPWVVSARNRLRHRILRVLGDLAQHSETQVGAAELLARAARADPSLLQGAEGPSRGSGETWEGQPN